MKKEPIFKFYFVYRLYIFPAIIVLSSFFLVIFVIYPQIVKLIENQKLAGDIVNKTQFLNTKVQALENYNAEELSQKVRVVLGSLPSDKEYGSVLGVLQNLIAQSGFVINSIALGNTSGKTGNANSFGINLEITGPGTLFQNLLTSLDNSPRILRVNSVDISSARSSDTLNAKVALDVLYSPVSQSLGNVDSPLPELSQKDEELISALQSSARASLPASSSAVITSPRGKANPFD